MNRLKKEAWKYMANCLLIIFLLIPFGPLPVKIPKPALDLNMMRTIVLPFFIFFGIWGILVWFYEQSQILKELDEREQLIFNNAKNISNIIFAGLCIAGSSLGLILYGFGTPVPFFFPILMGYAFWFVSIFARALIILIQLKTGRSDG